MVFRRHLAWGTSGTEAGVFKAQNGVEEVKNG